MKVLKIYEPAMCCATGVCGPSVDPELLRITTLVNQVKANGGKIERYNLTDNPMIFVTESKVNELLNSQGMDALPLIMLNDEVVKTGGYLSNEEILALLEIEIKAPVFQMNDLGGSNGL
ncbi:arsenite efflux transporter metallochaperone ArsD [Acidaminobacter sp. JC074]|uniref:arsenite efflux transporter metallochaperone ArsD n=1 Tax=Acidaminobacter sp. JC074 TaxID=2530199 RepID=UPI001F0D6FE5|nr:arsenite efflux transporter metallochaperone ArsD [Acidaminobacter sp. JC074]MCH4888366.1 arsenite efflux transporter metallochaperone ArsD [Acidaminobacter sp. JC074]